MMCLGGQGKSALAGSYVILSSTSPDLAPGTVVENPSGLALPGEAQVILLGEDGVTITLHGSNAAQAQRRKASLSGDLKAVVKELLGNGTRKAHPGAVRGGLAAGPEAVRTERCAAMAANRVSPERLVAAGCRREAAARLARLLGDLVPPALYVASDRGDPGMYRIGETVDVQVLANFDAHVFCFGGVLGERPVRLVPKEMSRLLRVEANRLVSIFHEEGRVPVAAPPPGEERIVCFAVDVERTAKLLDELQKFDDVTLYERLQGLLEEERDRVARGEVRIAVTG